MGPSSLWLLLLLSPSFRLTSSIHLRTFFVPRVETRLKWSQAKNQCQENSSHLVTVNNDYDVKLIQPMLINIFIGVFLGFHKKPNQNQSEWSNGDQMTFNLTKVKITNEQICETIHNNEWKGFPCNETNYFMCYNATAYQLIEKKKDWCEARLYCRKHYTDLVSINNQTQNEEVIKAGANRTFWIGLKHDQYQWDDGQCSTFRNFTFNINDNATYLCAYLLNSGSLTIEGCTNERNVICMKGDTRITVTPVPQTWEEAFDYCRENHRGLLFMRGVEEQTEVEGLLNVTGGTGRFWIGLRQSRLMGFWFWTTIDKVVDYHNWKDNRPPELPLSHHCGAIEAGGKWRDLNCKTKLPALCIEDMYPT